MVSEDKLTNEKFWDGMWNAAQVDMPLRPFFFESLVRQIDYSNNKKMIELGCVPGDNLIHLHRILGYKVSGIDFTDAVKWVPARLRKHGIQDANIIHGDLFAYNFTEQYDLVFSMGLVEHFANPMPVLAKHVELLKPGGWLLITLPNFRYFHYGARLIADRECLMKHDTVLMAKKRLRDYMEELNVKIIKCDYFGDFDFWCENNNTDLSNRLRKKVVFSIVNIIQKFYRHWPCKGRTSAFFSPWVVVLAQKI